MSPELEREVGIYIAIIVPFITVLIGVGYMYYSFYLKEKLKEKKKN